MISALFCVLFGLSLLPGRKPLCLRFAERISEGILPNGAVSYCRWATWAWFLFLGVISALGFAVSFWFSLAVPAAILFQLWHRNRRFRVVFHTSGSTGKSKTIVKTFESLAREVALHRRFYRQNPDYRDLRASSVTFLSTVDTAHMLGKLWVDMLPEAMGAKVDRSITLTPEELIAKMKGAEKVFLVTTPSFLDRFTAYADQYEVPRNCVEILTSGAALPPAVSKRTKEVFGIEPRQIFGSTETGGVAWMRGEGPALVLPGVRIKSVGERLAVKSPFSFKRGWYVMGDGAEIAPDGRSFRLLGRMDRLVKISEQRVNLAEMEDKVRALGYRDCSCISLEGEHGPYLALVLVGGGAANALEFRRQFLPVFPKGTVPRKFRVVDELPRNTQGKVLRSEIEKLF